MFWIKYTDCCFPISKQSKARLLLVVTYCASTMTQEQEDIPGTWNFHCLPQGPLRRKNLPWEVLAWGRDCFRWDHVEGTVSLRRGGSLGQLPSVWWGKHGLHRWQNEFCSRLGLEIFRGLNTLLQAQALGKKGTMGFFLSLPRRDLNLDSLWP